MIEKKNREIDEEKNNIHYNRVGASFQEGDNKNTINTTSNIERRMVVTAPHRIAQQQLTKAKLAENLKKRKGGRKLNVMGTEFLGGLVVVASSRKTTEGNQLTRGDRWEIRRGSTRY